MASSVSARASSASFKVAAVATFAPTSASAAIAPVARAPPRCLVETCTAILAVFSMAAEATSGHSAIRIPRMAEPARRVIAQPDDLPVDPTAIDRAYRLYRAQRRAKVARRREEARARLRFVITFVVLIALAIVLMLTLWHKVQSVFGL